MAFGRDMKQIYGDSVRERNGLRNTPELTLHTALVTFQNFLLEEPHQKSEGKEGYGYGP